MKSSPEAAPQWAVAKASELYGGMLFHCRLSSASNSPRHCDAHYCSQLPRHLPQTYSHPPGSLRSRGSMHDEQTLAINSFLATSIKSRLRISSTSLKLQHQLQITKSRRITYPLSSQIRDGHDKKESARRLDRKSTRLNSSHSGESRMPSSA